MPIVPVSLILLPLSSVEINYRIAVGALLDVPIDVAKNIYDANTFAIIRVSQAVFPHMAARKSGEIVNIGSVGGDMYAHPPSLTLYNSRLIVPQQPHTLEWRVFFKQSRRSRHQRRTLARVQAVQHLYYPRFRRCSHVEHRDESLGQRHPDAREQSVQAVCTHDREPCMGQPGPQFDTF